jgi:uncharacterized protein YndB with AHSA1/START domain
MIGAKVEDARVVQYELQIGIAAPRERVWRTLTEQLGSWWLKDSHVLGEDSIVTLEPTAGGRLYEQRGDASLLWYTVLHVAPNESMSLAGYCTPDWGGPCTTLLTLKLSDEDGGTRLSVTDALYGLVTDGQVESLQSGWRKLFTDGLKRAAEAE